MYNVADFCSNILDNSMSLRYRMTDLQVDRVSRFCVCSSPLCLVVTCLLVLN